MVDGAAIVHVSGVVYLVTVLRMADDLPVPSTQTVWSARLAFTLWMPDWPSVHLLKMTGL